jgi:hypothetical protein
LAHSGWVPCLQKFAAPQLVAWLSEFVNIEETIPADSLFRNTLSYLIQRHLKFPSQFFHRAAPPVMQKYDHQPVLNPASSALPDS